MDDCPESDGTVGMIVGKLKSGVVTGSPGAGEERDEGVDAWSVPSRSGVGFETGLKSPHPKTKRRVGVIHNSLFLFMILPYHIHISKIRGFVIKIPQDGL